MDAFKRAMGREETRELAEMIAEGMQGASSEAGLDFPEKLPTIRDVITSYSIHYTKLYEPRGASDWLEQRRPYLDRRPG